MPPRAGAVLALWPFVVEALSRRFQSLAEVQCKHTAFSLFGGDGSRWTLIYIESTISCGPDVDLYREHYKLRAALHSTV